MLVLCYCKALTKVFFMNIIPIGAIKTEFEEKTGVPIQSSFGKDRIGKIELKEEYVEGLKDLNEMSHVFLIYHFDRHHDYKMIVKPYMDETPRGLFATRAPKRPNGIGLSLVEIVSIENNIITFKGVDMLNNTPLLDIKPFVPDIDFAENARSGWYEKVKNKTRLSDDRF